jgi:hypothetical protein
MLLFFALASCGQSKLIGKYEVSIRDEHLADAIRKYVTQNKIDPRKKVITIKPEIGLKKVFTITNEFSQLYKTYSSPTYYGTLDDDKVFFIYTNIEKTFKRTSDLLLKEIDGYLLARGIALSKDTHLTYSAPVWRLVEQCDGSYELDMNVTPFEFQNLPCGYSIVRDSVKLDSIMLIRK